MRGLLDARVTVTTRGGDLSILWQGEGRPVLMTGPAVTVFEGELDLESFQENELKPRINADTRGSNQDR